LNRIAWITDDKNLRYDWRLR